MMASVLGGKTVSLLIATMLIASGAAGAQAAVSTDVPSAAGETCESETGEFVSGCARIGSYNLGHSYYWPGIRFDKSTQSFFKFESTPGVPEFDNVAEVLWGKCESEYSEGPLSDCLARGAWSMRKDSVKAVLQNADLDIVGFQEVDDELVWPNWAATGSTSTKTYRQAVQDLMSSLGFAKVNTTSDSRVKSEIYYRTDRYKLLKTSTIPSQEVVTEKTLMQGKTFSVLRDTAPNPGQQFVIAKLQRIESENRYNTVLVTNVHMPTNSFFKGSAAHTINGVTYAGEDMKGTAYRRWLGKFLAQYAGQRSCAKVCTGASVEDPIVPLVMLGDFNSTYTEQAGTKTAPYSLMNEAAYNFIGPDYGDTGGIAAELRATSIGSQTAMSNGHVIDHVLMKLPSSVALRAYDLKVSGLGTGTGDPTLTDYLASDHRLVKLTYRLKSAA